MSEPTFSVIMPVYNHAAYVGEAVGSVRGQSLADWELIIVDDGSTDGSAEVAAEAAGGDERISLLRQANAGPAGARNAGVARARGEWLAFLDSDDVWYPDALAGYAQAIAAHPDERFFHGYRHRLGADGTVTELAGQFQDAPTGPAELFDRMFLSHLCVCYRRELLDAVGGYDESLRSCEDYELYLRIGLRTRFVPLGRATGLRRRHGTNISRQTGHSRYLEAEVLRRFVARQGGSEAVGPEQVRRRLARLYYAAGRQYFKARCFAKSARALSESLRRRRSAKAVGLRMLVALLKPLSRDDGRELPRLE